MSQKKSNAKMINSNNFKELNALLQAQADFEKTSSVPPKNQGAKYGRTNSGLNISTTGMMNYLKQNSKIFGKLTPSSRRTVAASPKLFYKGESAQTPKFNFANSFLQGKSFKQIEEKASKRLSLNGNEHLNQPSQHSKDDDLKSLVHSLQLKRLARTIQPSAPTFNHESLNDNYKRRSHANASTASGSANPFLLDHSPKKIQGKRQSLGSIPLSSSTQENQKERIKEEESTLAPFFSVFSQ